ncbi:uncharacterized protein LOC143282923 [Babylonia areolata]|uniref:uncharacterized protein LOC143282923 n=1 Tax=Babylonia areolata TaxID=304850 RepID=UPI003FD2375F
MTSLGMDQSEKSPQCLFKCRQYVANPSMAGGSSHSQPDRSFSIVSYNILAECHRVRTDYSYTAEEFLCQDYRHSLLMKELQYLDGDVICLQEVSPDYFNTTLLPAMKGLGYDGLMMCRTKEYYNEGGATFFRTSRFKLESSKQVSLSEAASNMIEKTEVSPAVQRAAKDYLDRADVVVITCLRCESSGDVITVGNVHLWWDDDLHPDVKTIQAYCAVQEVVAVSGSRGAHVICGDFNSDCSSPVYKLVMDGYLCDSSIQTLRRVQGLQLENELSKSLVDHFKAAVHHESGNLKSSYSSVKGSEPELTCYTEKAWVLDYMFYSADTLHVLGILDIVETATVVGTGGLPSRDFPSDHLSLKTYFTFI